MQRADSIAGFGQWVDVYDVRYNLRWCPALRLAKANELLLSLDSGSFLVEEASNEHRNVQVSQFDGSFQVTDLGAGANATRTVHCVRYDIEERQRDSPAINKVRFRFFDELTETPLEYVGAKGAFKPLGKEEPLWEVINADDVEVLNLIHSEQRDS